MFHTTGEKNIVITGEAHEYGNDGAPKREITRMVVGPGQPAFANMRLDEGFFLRFRCGTDIKPI